MKRPLRTPLCRWPFILIIIFQLCSCAKDSQTAKEFIVTEQDAAEVISNSILPTYGGLISKITNVVNLSQNLSGKCGMSNDTTLFNPALKSNLAIDFTYKLNWRYWTNCNDLSIQFGVTGTNNYSGIHYSVTDQSNGIYTLTPKTFGSINVYKVKISQTRTGNALKKDIGNKTFTDTIVLQSDSVNVDKMTGKIISGRISMTLYGKSSSGFRFTGDFVFINEHKATLTITGGGSYDVSW